jgi:hypothetical protein
MNKNKNCIQIFLFSARFIWHSLQQTAVENPQQNSGKKTFPILMPAEASPKYTTKSNFNDNYAAPKRIFRLECCLLFVANHTHTCTQKIWTLRKQI